MLVLVPHIGPHGLTWAIYPIATRIRDTVVSLRFISVGTLGLGVVAGGVGNIPHPRQKLHAFVDIPARLLTL